MPRGQTDKTVVFWDVECPSDYGSAGVVVALSARVLSSVDPGIKPIFLPDSEWRTVQPHQSVWTMLFGPVRDPVLAADSAVPGRTAVPVRIFALCQPACGKMSIAEEKGDQGMASCGCEFYNTPLCYSAWWSVVGCSC